MNASQDGVWIRTDELTGEVLDGARCVCVSDGQQTLAIWNNPNDLVGSGNCQLIAVPEIRITPIVEVIKKIRALGRLDGVC
jgi:hypothetical protein